MVQQITITTRISIMNSMAIHDKLSNHFLAPAIPLVHSLIMTISSIITIIYFHQWAASMMISFHLPLDSGDRPDLEQHLGEFKITFQQEKNTK